MLSRLVLVLMAVFFILYGVLAVTNIKVEWDRPIMGFAALILGIVCAVQAVMMYQSAPPK